MEIAHSTKKEVFTRLRDKLRQGLPAFENRIVCVCGMDQPTNFMDRDFILVRARGGSFDWPAMMGSGPYVMPYSGTVAVEVWKNSRLDRSGADDILLLSDDTGLFDVERDIIATLAGSHLELTDSPFTSGVLTEALMPVSDGDPERNKNETFGGTAHTSTSRGVLSIEFGIKFHWKLL